MNDKWIVIEYKDGKPHAKRTNIAIGREAANNYVSLLKKTEGNRDFRIRHASASLGL